MANDVTVVYRALADFKALRREIERTRQQLRALRAEEAAANAESVKGSTAVAQASDKASASFKRQTMTVTELAEAHTAAARAADSAAKATHTVAAESDKAASSVERHGQASKRAAREVKAAGAVMTAAAAGSGLLRRALGVLGDAFDAIRNKANALNKAGGGGVGGFFAVLGAGASAASSAIKGLTGPLKGLFKLFILGGSIAPLIAGLGALGAAIMGVAGAITQTVPVLLTLPAALGTMMVAIFAAVVALKGIGKVFQAYSQSQKAAAKTTSSNAQQQVLAARRIADAQRALAEARKMQARSAADAAARVADAERNLVRQQRDVKRAQLDVNKARMEALKDLIDLRREVERGSLNEERAVASLAQAQEEYQKVLSDPNASQGDRLAALADLRQAEADLADTRKTNTTNEQKLADVNKKGIDATEGVQSALEAEKTATEQVGDAQRDLTQARQDQAENATDSATRVADAQRNLAEAQADAKVRTDQAAKAMDAYNEALKKLSPNARAFVTGIIAMRDRWLELKSAVQDAFFAPLVPLLGAIRDSLDPLQENLTLVAGSLGNLVAAFVKWITDPRMRPFFKTLSAATAKLIDTLSPALIDVLDGFVALIKVGLPFIQQFAEWLARGAESFKKWAEEGEKSGEIADKITKGVGRMRQIGRILGNLVGAWKALSRASSPFIDWLMNGLEKATQNFEDFSKAQELDGSPLKKYLEDIKPLLQSMGNFFKEFFKMIGRVMARPENIQMMIDLFDKLATETTPQLEDFLNTLSDSGALLAFIDAVGKLSEIFTALSEAGIGGIITNIINFTAAIADFMKWVTDIPIIGDAVKAFFVGLAAVLAGLAILKFAGILKLAGAIGKIAAGEGKVGKVSDRLRNIDRNPSGAPEPGTVTTDPVTGKKSRVPAAGAVGSGKGGACCCCCDGGTSKGGKDGKGTGGSTVVGGTSNTADDDKKSSKKTRTSRAGRLPGVAGLVGAGAATAGGGRIAAGAAGAAGAAAGAAKAGEQAGKGLLKSLGGKSGRLLKGVGKGLKGGGLAGTAAAIGGTMIGGAIGDGKGGARDAVGGTVSGAATGAGIGAMVGSVVPVVGTAIGAAVGGVAGGLIGLWKSVGTDSIKGFFQGIGEGLANFAKNIGGWLMDKVINPVLRFFGIKSPSTLFAGIGMDIIRGLINGIMSLITTVPGKILSGLGDLAGTLLDKGKDLLQGLWNGVQFVAGLWWEWWAKLPLKIVEKLGDVLGGAGSLVGKGKDLLQGLWNGATEVFGKVSSWLISLPGKALTALGNVLSGARSLAGKGKDLLQGLWNGAMDVLGNTGKGAKGVLGWLVGLPGKALSALGGLLTGPNSMVQRGKDLLQGFWNGITSIWGSKNSGLVGWFNTLPSKIADFFKAPIKVLIDTVINKGIIGSINSVISKIPKLNLKIDNVSMPFNRGGKVPGTGSGDRVPAMLEPGEVVIRKRSVQKFGLKNALHLNETGTVPGYVKGGVIPDPLKKLGSKAKDVAGGVISKAGDVLGGVKDLGEKALREGAYLALQAGFAGIRTLAGSVVGDSMFGVPKGASGMIMDKVLDWVKKNDQGGTSAGSTGASNPGLAGALQWAKGQAGKPYLMGGVGPDAYDCSGFMAAIENAIKGDPIFHRLFSTASFGGGPVGGWKSGGQGAFSIGVVQGSQMSSGIGHMAGTLNGVNVESRGGRGVVIGSGARGTNDPLFKQHFSLNGYRKGGQVRGGDLPFDKLDPLGLNFHPAGMAMGGYVGNMFGGLGQMNVPGSGVYAGVSGLSAPVSKTNNYTSGGITVENLNVNNPRPEPASDSLPRSIRKLAYLHGGN